MRLGASLTSLPKGIFCGQIPAARRGSSDRLAHSNRRPPYGRVTLTRWPKRGSRRSTPNARLRWRWWCGGRVAPAHHPLFGSLCPCVRAFRSRFRACARGGGRGGRFDSTGASTSSPRSPHRSPSAAAVTSVSTPDARRAQARQRAARVSSSMRPAARFRGDAGSQRRPPRAPLRVRGGRATRAARPRSGG